VILSGIIGAKSFQVSKSIAIDEYRSLLSLSVANGSSYCPSMPKYELAKKQRPLEKGRWLVEKIREAT
jgi:hypothetical protein